MRALVNLNEKVPKLDILTDLLRVSCLIISKRESKKDWLNSRESWALLKIFNAISFLTRLNILNYYVEVPVPVPVLVLVPVPVPVPVPVAGSSSMPPTSFTFTVISWVVSLPPSVTVTVAV